MKSEFDSNGKHSFDLTFDLPETNPIEVSYNYQHGQLEIGLTDLKYNTEAKLSLAFGDVSESRGQITLTLTNGFEMPGNDNINNFIGPAEHILQINYPLTAFDEATLRIENSWTKAEIRNQFNGQISAIDNLYAVSAENINTSGGDQNKVDFEAQLEMKPNMYQFGSILNYNNDAIYG